MIDTLSWGGAQKLQVIFAREAISQGIHPVVICLRSIDDSPFRQLFEDLGIEIHTFPARKLLDFARIKNLCSFVRAEKIEIIHTHLEYANILGAIVGFLTRVPVITTLHSIGTEPRHYHPVRFKMESWLLRNITTRVLAVGNAVADNQKKRLRRKSITVVPNCVEPGETLSDVERENIRRNLGVDPSSRILISVGRLSPPKGYSDLIAAFAILYENSPNVKLMIVGAGVLHEPLKAEIEALNLSEQIHLLGARDDVPKLLAASDLYVSSSHHEGLPLAILEAMEARLPVVATGVGDIPDIVTHDVGIVVPPKEPALLAHELQKLLQDPEQMRSMGAAARAKVVENFYPDGWFQKHLNLYQQILEIH